ncbi:MAG: histidinol dehydrogenase [Deltaproteobacteria bacterium]|nr:histidinol dehydrogenase [Deltaproteobacteria bacterium]
MLRVIEQEEPPFEPTLAALATRGETDLLAVEPAVRAILDEIREGGDPALLSVTQRIDGRTPAPLVFGPDAMREALGSLSAEHRDALTLAAARIRAFHEHQREPGRSFTDSDGVRLGWRIRPLQRVGVYAPGGKARYPSSVLMAAIPARVAGVREVVVCTPRPTAEVLAAASIAGVDQVFDLGGAVAVGALAYGTATVPRVDKIVGPGNLYVTAAKRLVFGRVAIDGLAGPSEILVVADDHANPEVVAADLLSQAEHDEAAYPLLVTLSRSMANRVNAALVAQLARLPRREVAQASVSTHGMCFVVRSLDDAARVATTLAAEHLALLVRDPDALFANIDAAGAVFLGDFTPEAAGDYLAGPSHVLPTGGAVRFSSPLGVYDFVTRTSIIQYDREALCKHADAIVSLARLEGLEAHARAVLTRTQG